jgi:two-component system chemotaxis sensor kinase CheA
MDDLINSFLDEAHELISDLEGSLLTLEEIPNDRDAVHRVFRVMHTLKGSGGMFGFDSISNFTHHLESIYFKIRNQELTITKEILSLTLRSVDLIKELLKNNEKLPKNVELEYNSLIQEIKAVYQENKEIRKTSQIISEKQHQTIPETNGDFKTFYIHFEPNINLLQNGTNPIYLIDELVSLGNSYVIVNLEKLRDVNNLVPDNCYISWDVVVATNAELNEIMDVFIFVEDDSTIDIQFIGDANLLDYPEFIQVLDNYRNQNLSLNCIELQQIGARVNQKNPQIETAVAKSDNTTTEVEEILDVTSNSLKQSLDHQENGQFNEISKTTATSSYSTIRVSAKKIETLMNLVSEMVTSQARINLLAEQIKNAELSDSVEVMEKLTRQLRDSAFEISLIPIESLLTRFKRLIRDLSNELKKEVNFTAEGADTELDKTIIENLSDPLMHIFRNAIDHGIEDAEQRKKSGKPEVGNIALKAYYSGTNVYIQIIDDGKGIDPEIIRKKAIEKGLISSSENLSRQALFELITMPGFSTAQAVTDISGRGVGMDVVKKNLQKIHGELLIDSILGAGTTFTLKLPLTLSIIDGLIVTIENTFYIIPILSINKIRPIVQSQVENAFNNTLVIDNEQISFINLRKYFNLKSTSPETSQLIVVNFENHRIGIVVDRVEKQSQVVVKSIGKQFHHQDIISGASIMGDGKVALVLDTNKIIRSFSSLK